MPKQTRIADADAKRGRDAFDALLLAIEGWQQAELDEKEVKKNAKEATAAAFEKVFEHIEAVDENQQALPDELMKKYDKIRVAFYGVNEAKEEKAKRQAEMNEKVGAARSGFKEAIEEPTPVNADAQIRLDKLDTLEGDWQGWQEAKAEKTEAQKDWNGNVAAAKANLKEVAENCRQGEIFE